MDGVGGYVGRIAYDFEQYGRMVYDGTTNILLQFSCRSHSGWLIQSADQSNSLASFPVFMIALNHYLFEVLQFDPVSQWSNKSSSGHEYYFNRVYFDMGTREFMSIKNGNKYQ